jgi:hypothetical protein
VWSISSEAATEYGRHQPVGRRPWQHREGAPVLSAVTDDGSTQFGSLAMVLKLVESTQTRWRAITALLLVPLVRAGARFESGGLVERSEVAA